MTDRATDLTDRDAFLSHSCIFEPYYLPIDNWLSRSENVRNTASLTFNSRLAFSVGIHVTLLAGVSPAKHERAMPRLTCIPMQKARHDLNASDAFQCGMFLM